MSSDLKFNQSYLHKTTSIYNIRYFIKFIIKYIYVVNLVGDIIVNNIQNKFGHS